MPWMLIPGLITAGMSIYQAAKGGGGGASGAPPLGPVDMNAANRGMSPGFAQWLNQMQGANQQIGSARGALGHMGNLQRQQQGWADYLQKQAMGIGGPTAAQSQFQSGLDQSLRSAMALGQSQAGVSPGAAMRSILEQQGGQAGQANAQAAALRAQEQQAAQAQLGNVYQQMGQQTLGSANIYDQMAAIQGQFANQGAGMSEADRDAAIRMQSLQSGQGLGVANLQQQQNQFNQQNLQNLLGGMSQGAAAAATQLTNNPSTPPPAAAPPSNVPYYLQAPGMNYQQQTMAKGGRVKKMADGGDTPMPPGENPFDWQVMGGKQKYQQMLQAQQVAANAKLQAQRDNQSLLDLQAGRLNPGISLPPFIAKMMGLPPGVTTLGAGSNAQMLKDIFPSGGNAFYNPGGANAGDFMSNFNGGQGSLSGPPSVADVQSLIGATVAPTVFTPGQDYTPSDGKSTDSDNRPLSKGQYMAAHGGPIVPGKAKTKGDSESNDQVPSLLSPGEIVLPRSIALADDAPEKAAQFVAALKKRKMAKGGEVHPLKKVQAIRAKLKELNALLDEAA